MKHYTPDPISESYSSGAFSFKKAFLASLALLVASGSGWSSTPTNRSSSYTYYANGLLHTENGPRTDVNDITTYEYFFGAISKVTNALGQITEVTERTQSGLPTKIIDANGVITTLTYDALDRLIQQNIGGQITAYTYDGIGQLTKITYADGSYLAHEYDVARRLTAASNNAGERTEYEYDLAGNITRTEIKGSDGTLRFAQDREYDALSRLRKLRGMNGQVTTSSYDAEDNPTSFSDALGHDVTQTFDALNRLSSVTDALDGVTQYNHNAQDRISSVIDPLGNTTTYSHDSLGNLASQYSPDTGTTTHTYDAAGNITQTTDARGVVTNYSYDALNRVTAIGYPGNSVENVSFSYDSTANGNKGVGRLTGFSNDGGSTVLVYDARGNLIQQTAQVGSEIDVTSYQYDNADRLTQITYPSGRIVGYQRDALGRIEQVQTQDDTGAALVTIIGSADYEPFGPLKSLAYGNGVTTNIQHDLDYRVSRITTSASAVWDFLYGYDAADNIVSLTDQVGSANKSYGYDALNRLTSDQNPSGLWTLSYDANGSRLGMDWTVAPGVTSPFTYQYATNSNRMTQFNGTAQTLDAAGNLIGNGDIGYSYNHANRLSGRSFNGSSTTSYRYNALGQRVATQDLGPTGKLTHYHYDRDGKFLGTLQLNADGSWFQRNEYLWLDDLPIAQIVTTYSTNNAVSDRRLTYIHADHLNTPRLMTDASQTIVWRWDRDAFGLSNPDENPDGAAPSDRLDLRFPGQILDATSGLYYNYFRDYDPASGRYVQSDPIGLEDGPNTYIYVDGNPLSATDPEGLAKKYQKPENPNKRKGAENRQPSGSRQRNIGHPEGEEHSRRPKGGFRQRMPFWYPPVINPCLADPSIPGCPNSCTYNPYAPGCYPESC